MAKKEKEQLKSITELVVSNPELQSSLIKFESVKKQLEEEANKCLKIKVTDDTTLSICENNLTKINDLCKAIEAVRVSEKEPYLMKGRAIDAAAAYVAELPEAAVTHLKNEKKEYILKVEAEKMRKDLLKMRIDEMEAYMKSTLESIASIAKLDAFVAKMKSIDFKGKYEELATEAEKIAKNYHKLFDLKKIELEAIETANPEEIEAIMQAAEEVKAEMKEAKVEAAIVASSQSSISFGTPKKVRRPWGYELMDINKVPKEWLMLDESKVKEYIKSNSDSLIDGQILSGIKYFKDLIIIT